MNNKNFIIELKEKLTTFRIQYKMAGMKAKDSLNITKQKELQNRLDKDYLIKDIRSKKLALRLDNSVRYKGIIYLVLSVLATMSSISLSVLGITNTNNFYELLANNKLIVYAALISLLQTAVWLISFNNNYIKEKFNHHYTALQILQKLLIGISMIGNYLFLSRLLGSNKCAFDYIFITVCSVSLDIVANKFSSLSMDCFYLNYSYVNDDKNLIDSDSSKNMFDMLMFIITYKFRVWIKEQYSQKIADYKKRMNIINKDFVDTKIKNTDCQYNNNNDDDETYSIIKSRLLAMENDVVVGAKSLGITPNDWRKIRERLLSDGLIYSLGTKSYKKNLLAS